MGGVNLVLHKETCLSMIEMEC